MTKFGTHLIVAVIALGVGVALAGSLGAFASRDRGEAPADSLHGGENPDDILNDGMERPVLPERHFDLDSDLPGVEPCARPDWQPVTATFTWNSAGQPLSVATLARAAGRVNIRFEGSRQEWFFMRNPIHAGYFSGVLVDHANERHLVFHHADLRFEGLARTWEGAGNLGLDRRTLESLEPTGETRRAFDLEFERHVRPEGDEKTATVEVWWNEELRLPLRVVSDNGGRRWVQDLTALEREANDADRLERPVIRYPEYAAVDLGDSCDLCGVDHGCGTDHVEGSRPTRITRTPMTPEDEDEAHAADEHGHSCGEDHGCAVDHEEHPEGAAR